MSEDYQSMWADLGLNLVEESCVGELSARNLTDDSGETVDEMTNGVVERYFQVNCGIFLPNPDCLNHIREMATEYNADGVIHYGLQFCRHLLMKSIPVEKVLEGKNIASLRIKTDYSMEDVGQLKARIEPFIGQLR